jgi:hypothetical protein
VARTNSVIVTAPRALQFDGVLQHQHAVAGGGDFRQQSIRQRGLAGRGAACDDDVLPLAHGLAQKLRLGRAHHAAGDVLLQRDHAHGALA